MTIIIYLIINKNILANIERNYNVRNVHKNIGFISNDYKIYDKLSLYIEGLVLFVERNYVFDI